MERQGWRCEVISKWHRERLGREDYAVDLDFVLVEYATGYGLPAALVEYKHSEALVNVEHSNYKAIARLGNAAQIPAIIVKYTNLLNHWEVLPLNDVARQAIQKLNNGVTIFDEAGFIRFLGKLRKRVVERFKRSQV